LSWAGFIETEVRLVPRSNGKSQKEVPWEGLGEAVCSGGMSRSGHPASLTLNVPILCHIAFKMRGSNNHVTTAL